MEMSMVMSGVVQPIARHELVDEVREAVLLERPGALAVCWRTEGRLTEEVYGTPWYVCCCCLHAERAADMVRAIVGPLGMGDVAPAEALRRFFRPVEIHFSDLLDVLDASGVPYVFRGYSSYGELLRFDEGEGWDVATA